MGLIEFISVRLAEDEAAARKAAEVCGCHGPLPVWRFDDEATEGRILADGNPHPGLLSRLGKRWNRSYGDMFAAEHIVRHDPARVLREMEAKRAIMDLHRPSDGACSTCSGEADMDVQYDPNSGEETVSWRRTDLPAPCPTVRLLAQPYADHPDYQAEWAP